MPDGFDEFVLARDRALLRFAYVLTGNSYLAEDIVQEVLARAYLRWSRIERMEAPEAYVRTAIVRQYLSWRRRKSSREAVTSDPPERMDPTDPAMAVAERDEMWGLLASLPRAQRAVIVLRFYEDMADDEIASLLGCAQPTVRARASRALARLRSLYKEHALMEADRG